MKLGLKPRDSISGSLKKPLGGVEGGGRIYKNLCNKGQVAGTKEVLAHGNHLLDMHLHYQGQYPEFSQPAGLTGSHPWR